MAPPLPPTLHCVRSGEYSPSQVLAAALRTTLWRPLAAHSRFIHQLSARPRRGEAASSPTPSNGCAWRGGPALSLECQLLEHAAGAEQAEQEGRGTGPRLPQGEGRELETGGVRGGGRSGTPDGDASPFPGGHRPGAHRPRNPPKAPSRLPLTNPSATPQVGQPGGRWEADAERARPLPRPRDDSIPNCLTLWALACGASVVGEAVGGSEVSRPNPLERRRGPDGGWDGGAGVAVTVGFGLAPRSSLGCPPVRASLGLHTPTRGRGPPGECSVSPPVALRVKRSSS